MNVPGILITLAAFLSVVLTVVWAARDRRTQVRVLHDNARPWPSARRRPCNRQGALRIEHRRGRS